MHCSIYHSQVNNNGHLSFESPYNLWTPQRLPFDIIPLIAVFWADVDTRTNNSGFVWYQITTSPDLLQRALKNIQSAYSSVLAVDYLLIATWDHVGYYRFETDKVDMS